MGGCFVVPYRKREEHLKRFVLHYSKRCPDIPIYVIEQADAKPFNRAKLFNVAFLLLRDKYDYFIFHDVDQLLEKRSDPEEVYAYPEKIVHAGTGMGQFNYRIPNKGDFFGGITIFSREQMEAINGWSNKVWGWGEEAEMVEDYIKSRGMEVERREAYYTSLSHPKSIDVAMIRESSRLRREGKGEDDGLNSCVFEKGEELKFDKYTLIKVYL